MGGLLFKTKRFPKKEYLKIENDILSRLNKNNIKYFIPKYFSDKQDFGDLDVLVPMNITKEIINDLLLPTKWQCFISKLTRCMPCGIQDSFENSSVYSVKYKDFQIDFIRIADENWDVACSYYSWNDLGNLIGRLAKLYKLKFGWDGLNYEYDGDQGRINIPISKSVNEILLFLNLDINKFEKGFKNEKEIFDFVIASKLFNPYIYDFENANKVNRDRDKKRRIYNEFLIYIQPYKLGACSYDDWKVRYREENIDVIEKTFPLAMLSSKIREIEQNQILTKLRKEKFSGNIVMELTGIKPGPQVKWFMEAFESTFPNFVDKNTKELIAIAIGEFYKEFSKKYKTI